MMIVGGPHALRGRSATLREFRDDWMSVDIAASGERPAVTRTFLVTDALLSTAEAERMRAAGAEAGTLWDRFEMTKQVNGMFRILPRRGAHSGR